MQAQLAVVRDFLSVNPVVVLVVVPYALHVHDRVAILPVSLKKVLDNSPLDEDAVRFLIPEVLTDQFLEFMKLQLRQLKLCECLLDVFEPYLSGLIWVVDDEVLKQVLVLR